MEDAALDADHVPATQPIQIVMIVAPTADDQVPALQLIQRLSEAGDREDHEPTLHAIQVFLDVDPSTDDHVPALQLRHAVLTVAAFIDDHEPALQAIQKV
jgi:hypothetical protein